MYFYDGLNFIQRIDFNELLLMELNYVFLIYSLVWYKGVVLVVCYL